MINNRLISRTARQSRGGFTLVELLVVIGIIAILAGVALGPITNGIKKAQQSSGMQSAHAIGLAMYSYANDNSQLYPDSATSSAQDVARALLAGSYVTDAAIFSLSGDTGAGFAKVSSTTNTATTITKNQISWDFIGAATAGQGVSSTSYPFIPCLWSTINGTATAPVFSTAAGSAITTAPVSTNPFGTAGIAVFYINNSAAFVTTQLNAAGTGSVVNMVTKSNNLGGAPAYLINSGT
jgi:prepilin-type N-terminal cleavage/methylation domain-containing protein